MSIYEGVEVEDHVFSPSMVFTNVINRSVLTAEINTVRVVRKGASIGANATIVCGNDIGNMFIGAGM